MYAPPVLSSHIFSAIVVALLASGVADTPLGLVCADQFPSHPPQAIAEPAFPQAAATTYDDRSRKSDRLLGKRADSVTTKTTIIRKNVAAPEQSDRGASGTLARGALEIDDAKRTPKLAPAPLIDCEPLVSPLADSMLSRFVGRCFV
jgi:hypothetical protein